MPFNFPFDTPHGTIPFSDISIEDLRDAIRSGMDEENNAVKRIIDCPEPPTFDNTIAPLDCCSERLDCATALMYNLVSADTSDALDRLAEEMAPELAKHHAEIMLNGDLFHRVRTVYLQGGLKGEDAMLLERTYENFERSGATLSDDGKEEMKRITAELSSLSLQFSQNVLKETNAFTLHVEREADLQGLPEMHRQKASAEAHEAGRDGWIFTLHEPSYTPFMTYCANRRLRRELYMAQNTKCTRNNEQCNFPVVRRIVELRLRLARLLGYENYAEYVLKRRMAQNVDGVNSLLDSLIRHYRPAAEKELQSLREYARKLEGQDFELQPWDQAYYAHLLRKDLYDFDSEALRPYFELGRVTLGIFHLVHRLYGITFVERPDIPVYHPEVKAYEVNDADGKFLAVLYTDFHPRATKQGGAWMTNYKEEWNGTSRPHVSVVMNLTRPSEENPSLLTLSEVETFLHEFGHAIHGIFAETRFCALSGTNVMWDFVELPSQIMENFARCPEFLQSFARHYQTDEPLPDALIASMLRSRNFHVALACMRQVSFCLLDMAYYTLTTPPPMDIRAFEQEAWKRAVLLPVPEETCMSVRFGHIMSGGYSAGYYSYKWAEVLDADAFDAFRSEGIFNKATASRFRRCILSKGGTEHPAKLYRDFRGRQPDITALLRRDGL